MKLVSSLDLYNNVATEVLTVLKHSSTDIVSQIPENVFNTLNLKSNKEYICKLDAKKSLINQKLLPETLDVLTGIFIKYCATEKEKNEFYSRIQNAEETKKFKSVKSYDEMFKDSNNSIKYENDDEAILKSLKITEKENIFKRIINKIIKFFKG